jgi:hypothetical protein
MRRFSRLFDCERAVLRTSPFRPNVVPLPRCPASACIPTALPPSLALAYTPLTPSSAASIDILCVEYTYPHTHIIESMCVLILRHHSSPPRQLSESSSWNLRTTRRFWYAGRGFRNFSESIRVRRDRPSLGTGIRSVPRTRDPLGAEILICA